MSIEPQDPLEFPTPTEFEPKPIESEAEAEAERVAVVEPPASAPVVKAEPVAPQSRHGSVDLLRGVAVLGILAMNINEMAWPGVVYDNPVAQPGAGPLEITLWAFNHIVFDTKMMTMFSMLFGAGLVLMDGRAEERGAKIRGVYYSRTFWLLVIGLIHSYLIWDGDILVWYAQCGFILYLFRKKTPKTLLITGTILVSLAIPMLFGLRAAYHYAARVAPEVEAKLRLDIPQTWIRTFAADKWNKAKQDPKHEKEKFEESIRTHRGTYGEIIADRAKEMIGNQTFGFVFAALWLVGGRMLIGMGLMKLGVLTAERSWKFYGWMTAIGYGIGLPLMAFDTYMKVTTNWSFIKYELEGGMLLNLVGGVIVVMGHIGLLMMIWKAGLLQGLTRRLANAGRMALSNYLFDSIFCTTLFYGYGFGLYGRIGRGGLYLIVIGVWTFQLLFSTFWLKRFRYGPAEWVWRTMTYGKVQPLRYATELPPVDPPPPSDEAKAEPVVAEPAAV